MSTDPSKNVLEFGFLPGQKIADLGAGSGHYVFPLSAIVGPEGLVIAVDLQQELLVSIKNRAEKLGLENIEVLASDIEKDHGTNLADESLDGVVLSHVLFQIKNKREALLEAKSILKKGGNLGIIEWKDNSSFVSNTSISPLPKKELEELCGNLGLKLGKTFDAGEDHFGWVYKKI